MRRTVKGVQSRSAKLREELAEAESVEQLVQSLFEIIDEMLDEMDRAAQSTQRANTKMRNIIKDRKAQLVALLSEE